MARRTGGAAAAAVPAVTISARRPENTEQTQHRRSTTAGSSVTAGSACAARPAVAAGATVRPRTERCRPDGATAAASSVAAVAARPARTAETGEQPCSTTVSATPTAATTFTVAAPGTRCRALGARGADPAVATRATGAARAEQLRRATVSAVAVAGRGTTCPAVAEHACGAAVSAGSSVEAGHPPAAGATVAQQQAAAAAVLTRRTGVPVADQQSRVRVGRGSVADEHGQDVQVCRPGHGGPCRRLRLRRGCSGQRRISRCRRECRPCLVRCSGRDGGGTCRRRSIAGRTRGHPRARRGRRRLILGGAAVRGAATRARTTTTAGVRRRPGRRSCPIGGGRTCSPVGAGSRRAPAARSRCPRRR